ncbi:type II toxin-antitoxin system RelE/ParE family toxin [Wenzhouxiangella sp. AB-CW3]|uniref:type II toxin-antitoxin system RelE/ParE family toxin n=1 Tax=Wenzhouxiangella sp. AB-CW3 TaxID=2771012 RepID=UPI00168A55B9|nr:type II toxin-antitoxin system RelE/ParE family toxin [Wenzhouxiangella sp. AB-CW3]QOC23240.1 type II toxin-antitoxin system RelE/ParE family toxin [Wenzhouxiangella sp. AB-CW3]
MHKIQDDIWELIQGSLRILFAHDGNRLILCTSGFVKKSQKTPKKEIKRAERILAEFREARASKQLEWVKDNHKDG